MIARACLDCGTLIPATANRCPEHTRAKAASYHKPMYDTPRWRRLRRTLIARHLRRFGYLCPGWQVPPHLAPRLSVDHIVPVPLGGAMYDEANLQIACTDCNASKGSRIGRMGFDMGGGGPKPPSARRHDPADSREENEEAP